MPTAVPPTNRAPLPEELLQYLSPYKVVVCTSCRNAIQPKAIARHLKEIHQIKISDRQPFMQHLEQFDLAEHELVMQYVPRDFPVPLLPVQSGLQCRSEDCAYLCVTEKRMNITGFLFLKGEDRRHVTGKQHPFRLSSREIYAVLHWHAIRKACREDNDSQFSSK